MTREEWIAYHVGRAPPITPQQWAATLLLLLHSRQPSSDSPDHQQAG